jgi:WD40-like Beta Propeller Repeat
MDFDLSADGKRVAFVVLEQRPDEPKYRQRIWITETEQAAPRPLLSGTGDEWSPRWSPDSTQLAFLTQAEGEQGSPHLHMIAAEGGASRLVCPMPKGISQLAWAPDGSCMTCLVPGGEEPASVAGWTELQHRPWYGRNLLWARRLDQWWGQSTTSPWKLMTSLTELSVNTYAWSPDSKHLALAYMKGYAYESPEDSVDAVRFYDSWENLNTWQHPHLGVIAREGGPIREVASAFTQLPPLLAWSHDQQSLAYIHFISGWFPGNPSSVSTVSLSSDHGQWRDLTGNPTWCCWMPDDRQLLYVSVKGKGFPYQISLFNVTDGTSRVLEEDVVLSPDRPWHVSRPPDQRRFIAHYRIGARLAITSDRRHFVALRATRQQSPDLWFGTFHMVDDQPVSIMWKQLSHFNG